MLLPSYSFKWHQKGVTLYDLWREIRRKFISHSVSRRRSIQLLLSSIWDLPLNSFALTFTLFASNIPASLFNSKANKCEWRRWKPCHWVNERTTEMSCEFCKVNNPIYGGLFVRAHWNPTFVCKEMLFGDTFSVTVISFSKWKIALWIPGHSCFVCCLCCSTIISID